MIMTTNVVVKKKKQEERRERKRSTMVQLDGLVKRIKNEKKTVPSLLFSSPSASCPVLRLLGIGGRRKAGPVEATSPLVLMGTQVSTLSSLQMPLWRK